MKKVVKRGNKWCVIHCHGSDAGKIIKCFSTKEEADRMHRAIETNKKAEPYFFYTDNLDFEEIQTKGGNEHYITGYISTYDKDMVNDIVTPACMSDMLEQMKGRNIKLDVEHESFRGKDRIETELNKTIIPIGRIIDAVQDEKGIKIKALLNTAHTRFREVWSSIKNKFLDAFSIAYIPISTAKKSISGEIIRMLDKVNLLNVALTGNPINTTAKMDEIFVKSLYEFETKPKDKRPPKAWWDNCIRKAKKFADDPNKFCGALWANPNEFGGGSKMRDAFGKSESFQNIKGDSMEEKDLGKEVEDLKENLKSLAEKVETLFKDEDKKPSEGETPEDKPEKTEDMEVKAQLEEIKGILSEQKSKIEEFDKFLSKPQMKGISEQMKAELNKLSNDSKGRGVLDFFR